MKTLYMGEIKRVEGGRYRIDDNKLDWGSITEVQLSMYLGAMLGAATERMRSSKFTGSLFIEVKVDEELGKEASND